MQEKNEFRDLDTPQKRLKYFALSNFSSIYEFTSKLGYDQANIFKYLGEKGRYVFRKKDILDKLEALGLDIIWYLHGEGEPKTENEKIISRIPKLTELQKLSDEQIIALKEQWEKSFEYVNGRAALVKKFSE